MTAIEWLANRLIKIDFEDDPYYRGLFNIAMELEKRQIIDFTNSFINEHTFGDYDGNVQISKTIEEYYNETFNK